VHANPDGSRPLPGTVHVAFAAAGGTWVNDTSARHAARIVVATGHDEANVALTTELWELLASRPNLEVVVEIDNRSMALTLAVAMAVQDPERHLDIVCRDDLTA